MTWQHTLPLALVLAIAGTAAGQEEDGKNARPRRLLVVGQAKG